MFNKRKILFVIPVIILCIALLSGVTVAYSQAFAENEYVYLGGNPIGIVAQSKNLIVEELVNVITKQGSYSPALRAGLKKGDIIVEVNGQSVSNVKTLNDNVNNLDKLLITVIRNDKTVTVEIIPETDLTLNTKKIGLIVKDSVAGIGTMTYTTKNGRFYALGHQIIDAYGNGEIYQTGNIYGCEIFGYNKARESSAGELKGKINFDEGVIGEIKSNKFYGISGKSLIDSDNEVLIKKSNRNNVHPGKAEIYTTIDGEKASKYEIEIVRTFKQNAKAEKSMVIRVTDKKLLDTTGGILQGMSGSPIVQDGKLVGAVTHVLTNDSRMGYGIYVDWME